MVKVNRTVLHAGGDDGVGDDDASRFTASRFLGQSCTCVGMTTESGAAVGRSIESLAAETGAILPIPDALTIQCLIFPDSTARRCGRAREMALMQPPKCAASRAGFAQRRRLQTQAISELFD